MIEIATFFYFDRKYNFLITHTHIMHPITYSVSFLHAIYYKIFFVSHILFVCHLLMTIYTVVELYTALAKCLHIVLITRDSNLEYS